MSIADEVEGLISTTAKEGQSLTYEGMLACMEEIKRRWSTSVEWAEVNEGDVTIAFRDQSIIAIVEEEWGWGIEVGEWYRKEQLQ